MNRPTIDFGCRNTARRERMASANAAQAWRGTRQM
jgi:hypothetical protein